MNAGKQLIARVAKNVFKPRRIAGNKWIQGETMVRVG